MIGTLIERYKQYRKNKFLDAGIALKNGYAFVGIGNHSISNLYPVIQYKGIPLNKIFARTRSNAEKLAQRFPNCVGVDNLQEICKDNAIKGVFVCAAPTAHFKIASEILDAGKSLFIEKPPCTTAEELEILIQKSRGKNTVVGVQKRYSKIISYLKNSKLKAQTYTYRYVTGAYPEGDEVLDLYVHALDTIGYLFGEVTEVKGSKIVHSKGISTYFVQFIHTNGTIGTAELSTNYSWTSAEETLHITTDKVNFTAQLPYYLTSEQKSSNVLGIPIEKVIKKPLTKQIIFDNNGFTPIAENNSLAFQGYVGEIEQFIDLVEGKTQQNVSSLESLRLTYKLMEMIKKI